ncbi:hypothetical protein IGI04_029804 [Brassica rapa subsp. trilocularis]|uniref:Retrotransposon gag domain-containing protein n=1 Tax=Brassica rapa subsp. trilocularis TaxID=1813537 RepID=A0ABQ7LNV2_BRACM|nr:hypothetical protein IGI04_029804 [Brassica rapa subsp. trilocularis]
MEIAGHMDVYASGALYEGLRGTKTFVLAAHSYALSAHLMFLGGVLDTVRLTSRSDCYRIGALGVLFFLFQTCGFYAFIDILEIYYMPPRKRVVRTQSASASREGGDENVPPPVPPIDQDALRQMVQDAARQAAHEAVQQAVQEAARVAAQEVVRQMAEAQQVPPVQVQGHQQPPIQPVPPVQVQGQQQPPIQQVPEVDETLMQVMKQMKTVDLETFGGTVDPFQAYNWKHRLATCLQTINCPLRLCLNIAELYLRGDALVWWDGVQSMRDGDMTYEDFLIAFDKKYFPREALHQKKNAFEHLRQGTRSVREYEREFCQLRLFSGNNFDAEDLIRRFLDGMRVDLRGRCSMVTYTSLEDLVEKAAVQEACIAEEHKYSKEPKTERTSGSPNMAGDQSGTPSCERCHRYHFGDCVMCFACGRLGHVAKGNERVEPADVNFPVGFPGELPARFLDELPPVAKVRAIPLNPELV